jgi:hypothetical protein
MKTYYVRGYNPNTKCHASREVESEKEALAWKNLLTENGYKVEVSDKPESVGFPRFSITRNFF